MMKVKCPVCGYEMDISNRKCPRCNASLFEALKCSGNCKSCKKNCSMRHVVKTYLPPNLLQNRE